MAAKPDDVLWWQGLLGDSRDLVSTDIRAYDSDDLDGTRDQQKAFQTSAALGQWTNASVPRSKTQR